MALEIQLLLQGSTRAAVEADLVEGEPGYNSDATFQELIYHVKGSPGTYIHFPSEEKLIQQVKANKTGGEYIGISGENMSLLNGGTSQSVFEQVDNALAGVPGSSFLDQYIPQDNSGIVTQELQGPHTDWTDTGGWVSTVNDQFTFTDTSGDGTSVNTTMANGQDGFSQNTWYRIKYLATNGGTDTTANLYMQASSLGTDTEKFTLPKTDGTHEVFFRVGNQDKFTLGAENSSAGAGSIVLSAVEITRAAGDLSTPQQRNNAITGSTTFGGDDIVFDSKFSGASFEIKRLVGDGVSKFGDFGGNAAGPDQSIFADLYIGVNEDSIAFSTAAIIDVKTNEAWGASARGSKVVWGVTRDGGTSTTNIVEFTGTNNGELELTNSCQLRFSSNPAVITTENLTHYITAVDTAGNPIKLGVVV